MVGNHASQKVPGVSPEQGFDARIGVNPYLLNGGAVNTNAGEAFLHLGELGNAFKKGATGVGQAVNDYVVKEEQMYNYNMDNALKQYQNNYVNELKTAEQNGDGGKIQELYKNANNIDGIKDFLNNSNYDGDGGQSNFINNNKFATEKINNFANIDLKNIARKTQDSYIGNKYMLDFTQKTDALIQSFPNLKDDNFKKEIDKHIFSATNDIKSGIAPVGMAGLQQVQKQATDTTNQYVKYRILDGNPWTIKKKLVEGMEDYKGDFMRPAGMRNKYFPDLDNIPEMIALADNEIKKREAQKELAPMGVTIDTPTKIATGQINPNDRIKIEQNNNIYSEQHIFGMDTLFAKEKKENPMISNADANNSAINTLEKTGMGIKDIQPLPNSGIAVIQQFSNLTKSGDDKYSIAQSLLGDMGEKSKQYLSNLYITKEKPNNLKIPSEIVTQYTTNLPDKPTDGIALNLQKNENHNPNTVKELYQVTSDINAQNIPMTKNGQIDINELKKLNNKKNDMYIKRAEDFASKNKITDRDLWNIKNDYSIYEMEQKGKFNAFVMTGKDYSKDLLQDKVYIMNNRLQTDLPNTVAENIDSQIKNDFMGYIEDYIPHDKDIDIRKLRSQVQFIKQPVADEGDYQTLIAILPKKYAMAIPSNEKYSYDDNGNMVFDGNKPIKIRITKDANGNFDYKMPKPINQVEHDSKVAISGYPLILGGNFD